MLNDIAVEKKKRNIGNYDLGKTLGNGSFGKVFEGEHCITKEKVAVKMLKKD